MSNIKPDELSSDEDAYDNDNIGNISISKLPTTDHPAVSKLNHFL